MHKMSDGVPLLDRSRGAERPDRAGGVQISQQPEGFRDARSTPRSVLECEDLIRGAASRLFDDVLAARTIARGGGPRHCDEAHFDDPETLDVTRTPNDHISFGFGTHFCLGASTVRVEIKLFFEELLARVDHLQLTGEVVEQPNAIVFGKRAAPLKLVPA